MLWSFCGRLIHPSSCCPSTKNTCAWGDCFACSYHWGHDDLYSSFCYCLSESKNKSVSKKETLTRSDSFFQTKCPRSKKRSCCCAWPHPSFWSDCISGHLCSCRTFSWSPSLYDEGGWCNDHLDGNYCVGICCNCIGCLIVLVVFKRMMPVVWTMAISNRKMSHLLLLWLLLLLELVKDTICFVGSLALLKKGNDKKRVHEHRFVCFRKLELMRLWLHEKICSFFSLVPWVTPLFDRGNCRQGSWRVALNTA